MQMGGDGNRNESESVGHKAALRHKKLKAKTLKWKSSNKDMNSKVEAREPNDGVYDDTVLCSITTASINSLISRKRVRTLGKVAQQCDSIDPPVPRRLRSAINKRARHVKKRRNLSAISAQISFADQQTRFQQETSTLLLTKEEEVADALLSLSQKPSASELTANNVLADRTNRDVFSTHYSEGGTKEGDKITTLPNAAAELPNQAACIVKRTENVSHMNPVNSDTNQTSNINQPLSEKAQTKDLSSGVVVNLPSPCKSSNHSARMQPKVQLDDSKNYPSHKPEAWLVDSNKSDDLMHKYGKAKNDIAQEIIHRVQTPLPCTPDGYLIKPSSSKLAVEEKTVSEFSKVTASGNLDKRTVPKKTWKRSITHVYVSHLIQMHLNKEKAPSQWQVKPEERSHVHHTSSLHKSKAHDETCYSVHLDVRLPVQPSTTGICTMSAAAGGRQKMVSGGGGNGNLLNLPASSTALAAGAQHVPYLHPQMAPRGSSMPYPFPHLPPHSRANLAPAAALQQMQQYMCYAPRPGLAANASSAVMKLQQQQQQMWQFHIAQYQARPDAAPPIPVAGGAGTAWHNMASSLHPMPMVPSSAPAAMELLCAPYQGGSRQPQQLRLI